MSGSHPSRQTLTLRNPTASQLKQADGRPVLIVVQGEEIGKRYALGEEGVVVGREPDSAQLVLDDRSVSARHARIEIDPRDGKYVILDLGSRNGTYVNGDAITAHSLQQGDKIYLGSTIFQFTYQDSIEERYHVELNRLIHEDSLSGLYQRRWMDIEYPKAFAQARASGERLCVLMMDMDGVKQVNDTQGHIMGSHCIAEVGQLIKDSLLKVAVGARFGGDEFMAFVVGVSLDEARALADEIRARVAECRFPSLPRDLAPTISIGVAELTPDLRSAEELMQLADDALYRAKKRGGNVVST